MAVHDERPVVVPRAEPAPREATEPLPGPPPVRWGVIGATARAAQLGVLPALAASPKAEVVAVASASGQDYNRFGARRSHASYEALLGDDDVEAVYVPLPNHLHARWATAAAEAGKHVLVEKPLATSAEEGRSMVDAAERAGRVLMEAYATPFHPRSSALEDLLRSGRLGELRFARTTFTGVLGDQGGHRWRAAEGGGALLDVGVYCLAPLLVAAGRLPKEVVGSAVTEDGGVDRSFSAWLDFGDGFTATFHCSFEVPALQTAEFAGTGGVATVGQRAFTPGADDTSIGLVLADGSRDRVTSRGGDAHRGLVDHFCTVVRGGVDPRHPATQSVEMLMVVDALRQAAHLGGGG